MQSGRDSWASRQSMLNQFEKLAVLSVFKSVRTVGNATAFEILGFFRGFKSHSVLLGNLFVGIYTYFLHLTAYRVIRFDGFFPGYFGFISFGI